MAVKQSESDGRANRSLISVAVEMNSRSFGVRTCVLADGQRIPILIDQRTGLPVEAATRFTLVKRWQVGCSSATAANELRSVALLMSWALGFGINVEARMESGAFFSYAEIEALVDAMRDRQREQDGARNSTGAGLRRHVVGNAVWYQRIKYVQGYLRWRMDDAISRLSNEDDHFFRVRQRAN